MDAWAWTLSPSHNGDSLSLNGHQQMFHQHRVRVCGYPFNQRVTTLIIEHKWHWRTFLSLHLFFMAYASAWAPPFIPTVRFMLNAGKRRLGWVGKSHRGWGWSLYTRTRQETWWLIGIIALSYQDLNGKEVAHTLFRYCRTSVAFKL